MSSTASTTFGDSGNTLFSVGNGTANNARHNAFEIRQNGDIYITSGSTDIKLQDHLGGGGGSITIDPSLDSGSTNAVANSAITKAFNGKIYGNPSTFSNSFVGSRTAYAIVLNAPTNNPWYLRCYDSSVPSYTIIGINKSDNFYDNNGQLMTDIPDWIDQELSYYDSNANKRYLFLKNGIYADYFSNVNYYTFTIYETYSEGLIGSLLTKHSIDTVAHTTLAEKAAWNAKVETSAITLSVTSASTDAQVPSAKAVYDAISAGGGGGGGLDDDTQLLLSTALTDLNDRKADLSEVRQNYQRKGDYATKSELAAKANVSDVMTLEKANENEQVTSYALNNLNNRVTDNTTALGGMKLVKITESEYTALTTKDENTLYVVIADPE